MLLEHPCGTLSFVKIHELQLAGERCNAEEEEIKRIARGTKFDKLLTWESSDKQGSFHKLLSHLKYLTLSCIGFGKFDEHEKEVFHLNFRSVRVSKLSLKFAANMSKGG